MSSNKPIYINQKRQGVFSEDGGVIYQITTETFVNSGYTEGDIRDAEYLVNLFVYTIVEQDSSAKDTFSNYATIADLDLLPADRGKAIASGLTQYRTSVNTLRFDSLSVAQTAASVVRDTINNLVDTYLRVKNDFIGSDNHYFPYPEEISSLREQYIQGYKASKDARETAEISQESSQQDYDASQQIYELRKTHKERICSISDKLAGTNTLMQGIAGRYVDTVTHIIDIAASDSDDLADSTSQGVLNTLKSYIENVLPGQVLAVDGTAISYVSTGEEGTGMTLLASIAQVSYEASQACALATQELASSEISKDTAFSDLNEKRTAKEAASSLEEAALAKLTLYCPSLDPSTI